MSRKSLDHILNDVDEPEESLDTEQKAEEVKAEAIETDEADGDDLDEPEKAAATEEKPSEKADKDEGDDKKDGLPPWMHARVKSATEARSAAEKRAEEAEAQLRQWQEWAASQQQGQEHQPSIEDVIQTVQQQNAQQAYGTKYAVSKRFAVSDFGAEEVKNAEAWAYDACAADPQLNARMLASDDPVGDAVREFRKVQAYSQLDQYGGDIDKLIEAKLAERGQVQTDEPASPQAQTQTQRKMPGNFTGSPSAQSGRAGPAFSGPTPLSDLLKS
jgi:hypothetical protein